MKKALAACLLLMVLTGCSQEDKALERGMALRSRILQAQGCSFSTDITADYGDKLHSFSLDCQGDAQGNVSFTVTSPDTISDITGTVSETGGRLTFDSTALCFPLLADGTLSPVSAPWVLLKTLRSGYLTAVSQQAELLCITIHDSYAEDALVLDIWLDANDAPIRAEILYDGRRILTLDVKSFQIL